jgi:ribosome-binding factor A
MGEAWADGEADPGVFFGATERSRKTNWKAQQLCKQVERAAALTLASECESDALAGASVVSVEPAPDAGRLRIVVCLASGASPEGMAEARAALAASRLAVRAEVARSIHRKRVPEIVFELRLAEEVDRG